MKSSPSGGRAAARVLAAVAGPDRETHAGPGLEPECVPPEPVLVRVSSVPRERVRWLWLDHLPLGKLAVLDGDPGLGKSSITLDLAARISVGRALPEDHRDREPAGVVLLSAEDGIGDTIRPRLEAAGADLDRVAVLTAVREDGKPRLPTLPGDVERLREAVRAMRAALVVVDPLMAFLNGAVDSHRDQDVRGALYQLAELAEREACSLLVVRHLNKMGGGHPLYRGGGSIGIIGAARAALLAVPDREDRKKRVLAVTKLSLAPIPPALGYSIASSGDTSRVEWSGPIEGVSISDLLRASGDDHHTAAGEADTFLRGLLQAGPVAAKDAKREAAELGIDYAALNRACRRLKVQRRKDGMRGGWSWTLPKREGEPATNFETSQSSQTSEEEL